MGHPVIVKVNNIYTFILDCNCTGETFSGTCNSASGVCDCKENLKGDGCNECIDNFYNFPNCEGKSIGPFMIHEFTNLQLIYIFRRCVCQDVHK